MNSTVTSLKARCVSRWRLMRERASCGLSYACSIRPSSSRCVWFSREAAEYDSFSRSSARMSSLVSCLYESGGKGMGENLRLSSQCTVVV